jgi:hypothetical protein
MNPVQTHARRGLRKFLGHPGTWAAALSLAMVAPGYAVERVWNGGSGVWAIASNWSPVGFVGFGDSARIGNLAASQSAVVTMDVNSTNVGLTIQGRAQVRTDGRQLVVNGTTVIDGNATPGNENQYARLRVDNGAAATDFQTTVLTIADEGTLQGVANATMQVNGTMTIVPGGTLIGAATVNVNGPFNNGGRISPMTGDMVINVTGGTLDLDGSNTGSIAITQPGNDLTISGTSLLDAFDGSIVLAGGSALNMSLANPWTLSAASDMLVGWLQSNTQANINGAPVTFGGDVTVSGVNNTLRVNAGATVVNSANFTLSELGEVTFAGSATVNGGHFELDDWAMVRFTGPTTVDGGTFVATGDPTTSRVHFEGPTTWTGPVHFSGIAQQIGNANVPVATTIHADWFDLDGPESGTQWNISAPFTINAIRVDTPTVVQWFGGVMNIAGGLTGILTVNLTNPAEVWTMSGAMNLGGDLNLFPTRVAGNPMDVRGTLTVSSGRAQITAPTHFHDIAVINLPAASSQLRLNARSWIEADTAFLGSGTLVNGANGHMRLDDGIVMGPLGLRNHGTLAIADTTSGIVTVNRFENAAFGRMRVSIGGPAAGADHDLLIVSAGQAVLAGALDVEVFGFAGGDFQPNVGDEFTIITAAGGVSGTFINSPTTCAGDSELHWTVVYESHEVTLRLDAITAGHPGDMNCDCVVSVGDISGFVLALTNPAGYDAAFPECGLNNADVNGDGVVSVGDIAAFVALITE